MSASTLKQKEDTQREDITPWTPPDGGYGWVVVFASFLGVLLSCSHLQIGVFMLQFASEFGVSLTVLGWLNAAHVVPGRFAGVFFGPIIQKTGCRKMMIAGTVMVSSGFLISSFITNIPLLFLTFGILPSIGLACCLCSSLVAPQQYFDRKRSLACGLMLSGLGGASFIWTFVATTLLAKLGLKLTLITEAAITIFIGAVSSVLLCPPGDRKKKWNHLKTPSTNTNDNILSIGKENICKNLRSIIDIRPLRVWTIAVFLLSVFFGCTGLTINLIYTSVRSRLMGINDQTAALHGSLLGITLGVTSFLSAVIGNIFGSNRSLMFWAGHLISGILSFISVVSSSSEWYFCYAVIAGTFQGLCLGVEQPLMGDLSGPDLLPSAAGWLLVQIGLANLVANSLSGWLLDITGNPNSLFFLAGTFQTIAGILVAYIPWVQHQNHVKDRVNAIPTELEICLEIKNDSNSSI